MSGFSTVRWVLKWSVIGVAIIVGVAIVVVMTLSRFAKPEPPALVRAQAPTLEQQGPVGGRRFDYQVPDSRVPRTPEQELTAPPITLIPERQVNPLAAALAPAADQQDLTRLVRRFLPAYETFAPGESSAAYTRGFAALVVPDKLDAVAERIDSHAPAEIGICDECTGSSAFTDALDPGLYMVIRRFSADSAYVTTQGVVRYGGAGSYSGTSFRRSYALLVTHTGGRWLVERVASDTIAAA